MACWFVAHQHTWATLKFLQTWGNTGWISDDNHWLPIKSEEQRNKRVHICPWLLADDIRIQNLKLLSGANHLSLTPDLLNKWNFSLVVYGHCYGSRLIIIDPGIGCWYFQVNEDLWLVGYHLLLILHFWLLLFVNIPVSCCLCPRPFPYFVSWIQIGTLYFIYLCLAYIMLHPHFGIFWYSQIPILIWCPLYTHIPSFPFVHVCQVKCLRGAFHPWAKWQSAAAPEVLPFKDLRIDFPAWGPHGARWWSQTMWTLKVVLLQRKWWEASWDRSETDFKSLELLNCSGWAGSQFPLSARCAQKKRVSPQDAGLTLQCPGSYLCFVLMSSAVVW